MKYSEYQHLLFERKDDGILLITINRPEVLNATNSRLHWELSRVWLDIADDDETNVIVITGAGRAFSAGGDLEMIQKMAASAANIGKAWKEAGDIVYNMINLDKPIISAINGVAVGAGLAVAFMADISIASESMRITDGHLRLGVAAGDHAVIVWPLLCGMAKAKYYLMTADFIDGKEAERIGLVSLCVPADKLDGQGDGSRAQARARPAAGGAIHEAIAQQLAARRRAGFRRIARDGDDGIFQRRPERRRRRIAGKTPAVVSRIRQTEIVGCSQTYAATRTTARERERGFGLIRISTSWSSAARNLIIREIE